MSTTYEIPVLDVPGARPLGRRGVDHDDRNRNYPARGVLFPADAPMKSRVWRRYYPAYDQGTSSSCVGQTVKGICQSWPIARTLSAGTKRKIDAYEIYATAQKIDPWPGEEPEYYGTSGGAGMRVAQDFRYITEYRWCFGLTETLQAIGHYAPVGIGVNWYAGFDTPDERGFISISGRSRGGHEVELSGVSVEQEYVLGWNSWGSRWGPINGKFKMTFSTLEQLLREDGDVVTVVV